MEKKDYITLAIILGVVVVTFLIWQNNIVKKENLAWSLANQMAQEETEAEKNNLINQNMDNQTTESNELKIEVTQEGEGVEAKNGDTVAVHYTGYLVNGQVFDSSIGRGEPIEFVLGTGGVIKGWDQGVLGMKVGEKRKLTIPSDLGYGSAGAGGSIPPNATLIFEVEMIKIN